METADIKVDPEEEIAVDMQEIKEEDNLLFDVKDINDKDDCLNDVRKMKGERDTVEDKKDLDFLFKSIYCIAAMKEENEVPPGIDAEKGVNIPKKKLEENKFCEGELVFAKMKGYPVWPARVSSIVSEKPGCLRYSVYFFGTHDSSVCAEKNIFSYADTKAKYAKPLKYRGFQQALNEIQEAASVLEQEEKMKSSEVTAFSINVEMKQEEEDHKSLEEDPLLLKDEKLPVYHQVKTVVSMNQTHFLVKEEPVDSNESWIDGIQREPTSPLSMNMERGEPDEIDDQEVAAGWQILEEASFHSDPDYNASLVPQEVNCEQEQDSIQIGIDANEEQSSLNENLETPGPSSAPDISREAQNASSSPKKQGFLCPVCGKASRSSFLFMEHKRSHEKNKSFKCSICGKDFFTKRTLEKHSKTHAVAKIVEASQFPRKSRLKKECEVLAQKLNIKKSVKEDRKWDIVDCTANKTASEGTHTQGSQKVIPKHGKRFVCIFCHKTFTQRSKLVVHLRTHTGERPYKCKVCGRGFTLSGNLNMHIRTHTGEKPFSCSVCKKKFSRHTHLLLHSHVHSGERRFKCNICSKSFCQSGNLKTHSRIHTGEMPFVCSFCGKAFKDASSLRKHILTHTGEKPFECNICGKKFLARGNLKIHFRIHSNARPFVCSLCGKGFKQQTALKYHSRIHTGERPFKCNVCSKEFSVSSSLRTHSRIHNDEWPFVCPICGRAFRVKMSLDYHISTHTGERPYCCDICKKCFISKSKLARHIKTKHTYVRHL